MRIIIIGGGIAGLSAGIYAQKSGFDSVVFESHSIPGGLCTGWDRRGFHIDLCLHWLTGTKPGTDLYKAWIETGALENVETYQPDYYLKTEFEGRTLTIWRDLARFRSELIEIAPEDRNLIEELCLDIKSLFEFEILFKKPLDLMDITDLSRYGALIRKTSRVRKKLSRLTVQEYVEKYKNPLVRDALNSVTYPNYSARILHFTLATFMNDNGGKPLGGSKQMALRMQKKYEDIGGQIVLRKEVEEIIIDKNKAVGIVLKGGEKHFGDFVVPACDTSIVFKKLLNNKYRDEALEIMYNNEKAYPMVSCVLVSLGVDHDLSSYPSDLVFQTPPFPFENGFLSKIHIRNYCYEPGFSPPGKSIITVSLNAKFSWWKDKLRDPDEYNREKSTLGIIILKKIEKRFPELESRITLLDVATPITFERFTNAYKGSYMSFGSTPLGKLIIHDGKVKGIKNLFMCGQWLMPPGGLPVALVTGKWAIQRILHVVNGGI